LITINLQHPGWTYSEHAEFECYFIGYLCLDGSYITTAEDFLGTCSHKSSPAGLRNWIEHNLLPRANGNFSFIIVHQHESVAAVDIIRSYPVYLVQKKNELILTDSIAEYRQILTPLTTAMEQFAAMQFVSGSQTIYEEVTSIRPGEILSITEEGGVSGRQYFRFIYDLSTLNDHTDKQLCRELDDLLLNTFKRMLWSAPETTQWVIPLSGGLDSRLIANYLFRLGIENVLCFSYGIPGNEQSRLSREVSGRLGYRWEFIEYTEEKWQKLHQTGEFDAFIDYAFNGDSLPHLQDFLAVFELREKGMIDEQAVFVPGHTLGFISDFVTKDDRHYESADELAEAVLQKNVKTMHPGGIAESIRSQIHSMIEQEDIPYRSFMEYYLWANRHTKFTAHSVKVYEYFGYRWRLPYWERELVNFWLGKDIQRRSDQYFYLNAAENTLLTESLRGIPFAKRHNQSEKFNIKDIVKKLLPDHLLALLNRLANRNRHRDEGLTQIYARKAKDIDELIGPAEAWPENFIPYIKSIRKRYTCQINYHILTAFYTLYKEVVSHKMNRDHEN
jgi:asparagine synthase (glutamine-hydrolysing)